MPLAVSKKHLAVSSNNSNIIQQCSSLLPTIFFRLQSELLQNLDENDLKGFTALLRGAAEANLDLNEPYGPESGHKTILHLALEEDDGVEYAEELLKVNRDFELSS